MTTKSQSQASWMVTAQILVLADFRSNASGEIFLPCADQSSKAAFRTSLSKLFSGTLPFIELWILLLPVLPIYVAYWFWQRQRPQPGWLIDKQQRSILALRQKKPHLCQLTPEMGLLAHHRQIDITHPTQGPILTLFTAAPSNEPEDAMALESLALTLAEQLQLRLVGCRVQLN